MTNNKKYQEIKITVLKYSWTGHNIVNSLRLTIQLKVKDDLFQQFDKIFVKQAYSKNIQEGACAGLQNQVYSA